MASRPDPVRQGSVHSRPETAVSWQTTGTAVPGRAFRRRSASLTLPPPAQKGAAPPPEPLPLVEGRGGRGGPPRRIGRRVPAQAVQDIMPGRTYVAANCVVGMIVPPVERDTWPRQDPHTLANGLCT